MRRNWSFWSDRVPFTAHVATDSQNKFQKFCKTSNTDPGPTRGTETRLSIGMRLCLKNVLSKKLTCAQMELKCSYLMKTSNTPCCGFENHTIVCSGMTLTNLEQLEQCTGQACEIETTILRKIQKMRYGVQLRRIPATGSNNKTDG